MTQTSIESNLLFYYATIARQAAREAGEVLKAMLETAQVYEKSTKDLVTDADVAAQKVILGLISSTFPEHAFVGEEESAEKDLSKIKDKLCWVVDPIDGTANYVHRLNNFAVSIALVQNNLPLVGIVFDPMSNEMFTAIRGHGAAMNDRPIAASQCTDIDKAMIAASFPPSVQRNSPEIQQFINVLLESQSIRRLGSAALNLCFVACGRLDGYWANKVHSWDIAAGALIAQEAGACLKSLNGSEFDLTYDNLSIAATAQLHATLIRTLGTAN